MRERKRSCSALILLWLLLVLGCGPTLRQRNQAPPTPTPSPSPDRVVSLTKLMGQPPSEFERLFGTAKEIDRITNNPAHMPGEYRDYAIPGTQRNISGYGMTVRFYK